MVTYLSFMDDLIKNNSFTIIVVEQRHISSQAYIFGPRNGGGPTLASILVIAMRRTLLLDSTAMTKSYGAFSNNSQTKDIVALRQRCFGLTQRRHIYYNGDIIYRIHLVSQEVRIFKELIILIWVGHIQVKVTTMGFLGEILIFEGVLSETEIINIQAYLSTKWQLESIVDSDGDGLVDSNDSEPTNPIVNLTCQDPNYAQKIVIDNLIPNPHPCGKPPSSDKKSTPPWSYVIDSSKINASSYKSNVHGYHDRLPSLLFDGCADDWYPWTAEGKSNEWLTFDLSGTKLITKIEFSQYPNWNNRAPAQITISEFNEWTLGRD